MLVNKLGFGKMDFRKKVKTRIWLSALLIVLGALSAGVVLFAGTFGWHGLAFTNGFYLGLGFGLMAAGLVTILKNVRYLKNAEKFKVAEIADQDERNRFVSNRTWSLSAAIMLCLVYLAVIIAGMCNIVVFKTLLIVLGAFALVLLIVHIILKKIY